MRSIAGIVTITIAVMALRGCQNLFIYYPDRAEGSELLRLASVNGILPWPEAGSGRMGWLAPADTSLRPDGTGTADRVVIFHGNAGHGLQRIYFIAGLRSVGGTEWDIHLIEYPGYGSRPGRPNERRIVQAGLDAVDALIARDPSRPVYLIGESLGSGVAAQVAAARPEAVPAIFLITPFTNLVDVGSSVAPRFLVRLVLRDRYDSEQALAEYSGRVGVLIAGRDEVVPAILGRRLYEGYRGPKRLWVQDGAGHNTIDYSPGSPWWTEMSRFLVGDQRAHD